MAKNKPWNGQVAYCGTCKVSKMCFTSKGRNLFLEKHERPYCETELINYFTLSGKLYRKLMAGLRNKSFKNTQEPAKEKLK
ncbi:MAG: hypothetical protein ACPGJV_02670 [Bacteriovoracaceae bacterium]